MTKNMEKKELFFYEDLIVINLKIDFLEKYLFEQKEIKIWINDNAHIISFFDINAYLEFFSEKIKLGVIDEINFFLDRFSYKAYLPKDGYLKVLENEDIRSVLEYTEISIEFSNKQIIVDSVHIENELLEYLLKKDKNKNPFWSIEFTIENLNSYYMEFKENKKTDNFYLIIDKSRQVLGYKIDNDIYLKWLKHSIKSALYFVLTKNIKVL